MEDNRINFVRLENNRVDGTVYIGFYCNHKVFKDTVFKVYLDNTEVYFKADRIDVDINSKKYAVSAKETGRYHRFRRKDFDIATLLNLSVTEETDSIVLSELDRRDRTI